jgi:hypothetical protein
MVLVFDFETFKDKLIIVSIALANFLQSSSLTGCRKKPLKCTCHERLSEGFRFRDHGRLVKVFGRNLNGRIIRNLMEGFRVSK